ncbi:MAG: hypothetical protein WD426_13340 [Anditalea sp.]
MKNEDKIVELLSELLIRQDKFETALNKLGSGLERLGSGLERLGSGLERLESGLERLESGLDKLANSQERLIAIQERQEKILINILEVLADDVPKFDELIEMEQLEGGKKVVLRKSR